MSHQASINVSVNEKNKHFIFILLNSFSLIAFASAIEPLRLANRMAGRQVYKWTVCTSELNNQVICSNGTLVNANSLLPEVSKDDSVIICGGTNIKESTSNTILSWLRREARKGIERPCDSRAAEQRKVEETAPSAASDELVARRVGGAGEEAAARAR